MIIKNIYLIRYINKKMRDFGNEDGIRDYLTYSNEKVNIQTKRPNLKINNEKDLIFMQIDADCDMITPFYGK